MTFTLAEREGERRLIGRGAWTPHWFPWLCLLYWFSVPTLHPSFGQWRGLPPCICLLENSSTSRASISTSFHMAPNFFLDCNHPSCNHIALTACWVFSSVRPISSLNSTQAETNWPSSFQNLQRLLPSSLSTGGLAPYFTEAAAIRRELLQGPPPNLIT